MAKLTIDIPDEEIRDAVKGLLAEKIARDIYDRYGSERYFFRKDLKEAIRGLLKENLDDITERAVEAAAKSIETRGVKKLLETLGGS